MQAFKSAPFLSKKLIPCFQLEQKIEEAEMNNSILIEISKTAVSKWQEKLKTRYGWFKSDNCKNIIFDVSEIFQGSYDLS